MILNSDSTFKELLDLDYIYIIFINLIIIKKDFIKVLPLIKNFMEVNLKVAD